MKQFLAAFLIGLFSLFLFNNAIYAHSRGVPILKINEVLTKVYPNESSSIKPYLGDSADIASENYLVNQNLDFQFEASWSAQLLEQRVDLEKTTYIWDFGDGGEKQKTNTPKNSHTYTKMGSYIMEILADDLVVQSTLLHILPNKDYKLPEPIIKINDQIALPPKNNLELDLNKRLKFDASSSKSQSSKIIEYQWDLGQGDVVKTKTTSYKYKLPQYFTTVVLRVKDENDFIVESFINLRNSGKNEPSSGFSLEEIISPTTLLILAQVVAVLLGITWYLRRKQKKI